MPTVGASCAENAPLASSSTAAPLTHACSTPYAGSVVVTVPVTAIIGWSAASSSSPGAGDVTVTATVPGAGDFGSARARRRGDQAGEGAHHWAPNWPSSTQCAFDVVSDGVDDAELRAGRQAERDDARRQRERRDRERRQAVVERAREHVLQRGRQEGLHRVALVLRQRHAERHVQLRERQVAEHERVADQRDRRARVAAEHDLDRAVDDAGDRQRRRHAAEHRAAPCCSRRSRRPVAASCRSPRCRRRGSASPGSSRRATARAAPG